MNELEDVLELTKIFEPVVAEGDQVCPVLQGSFHQHRDYDRDHGTAGEPKMRVFSPARRSNAGTA